ncbi:hypothetical protein RO3G_08713 [Lichtheimia corymbifera JMRC:FSU:9682]|uniref:Homeobox domain-containing protein n=1 Tax=Lichtheimia corymbifera JMRC:FSU:9682 TaxID=1263082 RepID=A0A068S700_9FUNG|nr:hypothetical protein RO3G_08713 [Lichtheimia corymbifera JMRC:FSU:9682]
MSTFTRDVCPRIFTPLVVYHDHPSAAIPSPQYQIDRHLAKTTEMLRHNAHFWVSSRETQKQTQNTTLSFRLESPLVSPTASTSTSSWSSATCEYQQPQRHYTIQQQQQQQPQPRASTSKRRRGNLPKQVTEYLKAWLVDHKQHPYPSEKEKLHLAQQTGLTVNQISNWFINARRRILQPMLESESLQARLIGQHLYGLRQSGLRGLPPPSISSSSTILPPPTPSSSSSWAFGERTTMDHHVDADRVTRDTT